MYICNLVFGLEILMPGIFLGLKFQACVFFGVCNMKLRLPPRGGTSSTPLGFIVQLVEQRTSISKVMG